MEQMSVESRWRIREHATGGKSEERRSHKLIANPMATERAYLVIDAFASVIAVCRRSGAGCSACGVKLNSKVPKPTPQQSHGREQTAKKQLIAV